VHAWQILLQELKTRLHRKRILMVDVKAYESLRLLAQRQKRSAQEIASQLFDQAAQGQNDQSWTIHCLDQLSPRQKQIAAHVCRGETTRQIAAQLIISETTVKSYIEIILLKFDINSRQALRLLLAPWA